MNYLSEVIKNKDQIIKDMIEFLKIESILKENPTSVDAPFGEGIKNSLMFILKLAEKMGFKTKNIDNIAGHIEYGEGDEIVGVLCHVDVVPADGDWTYPPFSAKLTAGRIYARGAIDDKGPLICALYALKILKELNYKPNKRIRIIAGTDEETQMRGIKRYLEKEEMPTIGFSPDADFPLIYGEKGIMSLDLCYEKIDDKVLLFTSGTRYNVVPSEAVLQTKVIRIQEFKNFCTKHNLKGEVTTSNDIATYKIYGKSAHAMEPKGGVNAAIYLAEFLNNYYYNPLTSFIAGKLKDSRFNDMGLNFHDQEMGDLTVNVAIINFQNGLGKIGLNLRYPINWDKEKFLNDLQIIAKDYHLKMKLITDKAPHYIDKNDKLITILHDAYIKYTNDTASPLKTIGGGTYARVLKKAVAFGPTFPGREDVVHQQDEYIIIDDALKATAIFAEAMEKLGK